MARMKIAAKNVMCGDMVDLEGDQYADPNHDNPALEFEFAVVMDYKLEGDDCIAITFDHDVVGFPLDHLLEIEIR